MCLKEIGEIAAIRDQRDDETSVHVFMLDESKDNFPAVMLRRRARRGP